MDDDAAPDEISSWSSRAGRERAATTSERYRCSDSSTSMDAPHSNATASGTTSPSSPATRPSPIRSSPLPATASCTRSHERCRSATAGGLIADAVLGAPIPRPRQVFGIGLNYRDHAGESGAPLPPAPLTFTKFPSCIAGPTADVPLSGAHGRLGSRDRRRDRRRGDERRRRRRVERRRRTHARTGHLRPRGADDRRAAAVLSRQELRQLRTDGPGARVDRRVRRSRRHRAVVRRRRRTHASRTHEPS